MAKPLIKRQGMNFSFAVTGMSIGMPLEIDFEGVLIKFCLNSSIRPHRAVSIEKTFVVSL